MVDLDKRPLAGADLPTATLAQPIGDADWLVQHRALLHAATADNTRLAYRSAVRHFQRWGGLLPCHSAEVIRYLLAFAETLNPRTLTLRLTALSQWHVTQGFTDPTQSLDVRKTLLGIHRIHGKPKKQARALTLDELTRMVVILQSQADMLAQRDNALLQLAFFGAFRRSEIVRLTVADLQWQPAGLLITLPRSKTDQTGDGICKAIPYGGGETLCPASAVKLWLATAAISSGPLFRAINRWGVMSSHTLHPSAVSTILVSRAKEAELVNAHEFSSHSFRRGLATSAHRAGAAFQDIKRQGGWRHDGTVQGYIEEAERFSANAAGLLLKG